MVIARRLRKLPQNYTQGAHTHVRRRSSVSSIREPLLPISAGSSSPTPSSASSGASTPSGSTHAGKGVPKKTFAETYADLIYIAKVWLLFLPSLLRRPILKFRPLVNAAKFLLNLVAHVLYNRGLLATNVVYDSLILVWSAVVGLFFREVKSRGAWRVPDPGECAVIFVAGPHHNQFVDGLTLMTTVRNMTGQRASFIIAEKSTNEFFIGPVSKLMQAIPVVRPQDLAIKGVGTLTLSADDPMIVIGFGTQFLSQFKPKMKIQLGKDLASGSAPVGEVLDDQRLRLFKPFEEATVELLGRKPDGVPFKIVPFIDQTRMFSSVYQKIAEGGAIGIFPEGGSHDRPELLPLKPGVALMSLGALASDPSLRLRIVPVGLSYFHPHKFRSRAVVEFGEPIEVPAATLARYSGGGEEKKAAVEDLMTLITQGLKAVTVQAPDYDTLMLIQAGRRLYRPPGKKLSLGRTVDLTRRFSAGYLQYKDDPKLQKLAAKVTEYNTLLDYLNIKDHQVQNIHRPAWRSALLLVYRMCLLVVWGVLALPGVVLNAPIFIIASYVSRKKRRAALKASTVKIKANDVVATWKVVVALVGAPALYLVYAFWATILALNIESLRPYAYLAPIATWTGLPIIGLCALKFGEVGVDVYKSLRPLLHSTFPGSEKQLDRVRAMRAELRKELTDTVNEFGPKLYDDFRALVASPDPNRRPSNLSIPASAQNSWLDSNMFGWPRSPASRVALVEDEDARPLL